jgi:bacterioferritin
MQGDNEIITLLNTRLLDELTSADQYFIHSKMYHDWGYSKLGARSAHERQEEMNHANQLIERILFLGGVPDMVSRHPVTIGTHVLEMLESDLALEYKVASGLREVIAVCEKKQDYVTRDILLLLLDDTERDHAYWLEQQLKLIEAIGLQNYLQTQI